MTALTAADRATLDQELAETREQIQHLRGTLKRDLAPSHREKVGWQLDAARRHRDRLEQIRRTA